MDERISEIRAEIERQMAYLRQPLFTSEAPPSERHVIAYLHLTPDGWDTYAEGYRRAGEIIAEYVIDNDRDQDLLIYPVAFLYRQYIELRLKELWLVSSKLLEQETKPLVGHDLMKLWSQVRPNIEQYWLGPEIKCNLGAIEERLEELSIIDRSSTSFRYPEDKKGIHSLERVRCFSLMRVRDVLQAVSMVLDGISSVMGEYIRRSEEKQT
jgi:hypothetical protein